MRHNVYGKHLGRDKNQRTALFRGLVRSLILQGSIKTTETKAKAVKGLVDKLVTAAKKNTPATRRVIESFFTQPEVSKKILEEIAPSYNDRSSGFTTLVKLGSRAGDGAMVVKMSMVKEESKESQPEVGRPLDEKVTEEPKKEKEEVKVEGKKTRSRSKKEEK